MQSFFKNFITAKMLLLPSLFLLASINVLILHVATTNTEDVHHTNAYIVYLGESKPNHLELITSSHHQMLASVLGSEEAAVESTIYSYRHGFSGFAAKLTRSQAKSVAELPSVVKVFPNSFYELQTTRSFDYLGLSRNSETNILHDANQGDGAIIGVIDTGIWPESKSFSGEGLGPIPAKWKGYCQSGDQFNPQKHCNRKLIGAQYFIDGFIAGGKKPYNGTQNKEFISPRDSSGHGTHCASTAVGSFVSNVSSKGGLAAGNARGGAPRARLAVYKVGWRYKNSPVATASAIDVLKAFETAIHDGVDVLSVSWVNAGIPLYPEIDQHDIVYYGSFHAVAHGITVVCAGGNNGPKYRTIKNVAPWVITVAASTMDRSFPALVMLGSNKSLTGLSAYVGNDTGFLGLVYEIINCEDIDTADKTLVAGKVVLCFFGNLADASDIAAAAKAIRMAGGRGVIGASEISIPPVTSKGYPVFFPCHLVSYDIGTEILNYIRLTREPTVRLKAAKTYIGKQVSTYIADFSSRGPNSISPAILKPDIAAPGVDILAASIPRPTKIGLKAIYVFYYGTSMATPHVAGIAALLKCLHPNWSPATIKSALVTTGWTEDPYSGELIFAKGDGPKVTDPFDYGGGIVNPNAAKNPGLIYDMGRRDYIAYLCGMGYSETAISLLTGQTILCRNSTRSILDVNIPSITVPNLRGRPVTVLRTVINVGRPNSEYQVFIDPPHGTTVKVKPRQLSFSNKVKKRSFEVTITKLHNVTTEYYFGGLTWTDGVHKVRIPISVKAIFPLVSDY